MPSELSEVCFISDLHLSANMPKTLAHFEHFCATIAPKFKALIILGDLFEYWLGDDTADKNPAAARVAAALSTLSGRGVFVGFMVGNRDFLVREAFCKQAKIVALPDPCIVKISGQNVLLTHGDLLCSNDVGYQRFRSVVHVNWIQNLFLKAPLFLRESLAQRLRTKSKYIERNPHKQAARRLKQDVPAKTAQVWFKKYDAHTLIHGHTHQPSTHLTYDTTRIVLPDWDCDDEAHCRWGYIRWMGEKPELIVENHV